MFEAQEKRINGLTFDNLVIHKGNRFAAEAARKMLCSDGGGLLYIYGPSGCGKTHLLEAVYSELRKNSVERIHISTAEEYCNELFEALAKKGMSSFRETNRTYEAMLIDDVQFISEKSSLAVELSFNIDSVLSSGGKVIITADRGPEDIKTYERFRNRLASGVTAGVELPGKAALNAVGQSVAERLGVVVSSDHIASLAEKYSNPWLLTGAIKSASVLETIEKGDL